MQILSAHAPQCGRPDDEKESFWEELDDRVRHVAHSELLLVAGDMNGHVGASRQGFEEIMGPFGFGVRNRDGLRILEFCQGNE